MTNTTDEDIPKWKKPRLELPPDVDPQSSSIELVVQLILKNNKETRPRHRFTLFDILNEAFITAVKQKPLNEDLVFAVLEESRTKHAMAPRSGSLSQALFYLHKEQQYAVGIRLVRWIMSLQQLLPGFFRTSFDEKVVAVATRNAVHVEGAAERVDLILSMLKALPADSLRRRVFAPIFESHCIPAGDTDLMCEMLRFGLENELEFWDEDYHAMLRTVAAKQPLQPAALETVLRAMMLHHPVVGRNNANLVAEILVGSSHTTVSPVGVCSNCQEQVQSFDLTAEERAGFQKDVVEKLMLPRTRMESHYEKDTPVTPAVQKQREEEIARFFACLDQDRTFNAVIDGANVGYYGLSSWYREAKLALLTAQGISNPTVDPNVEVPFPVDVSPKFEIIDDMVQKVRALGLTPVVMLHERHLSRAVGTPNATILSKWTQEKAIISTPYFLNDDYCWLAAAVGRPGCVVVTNDLMRDHHFLMLSQRPFLRWRQRFRITYRAFVHAGGTVSLAVRLPRPFSVWVQQSAASHRWHIPYSFKPVIEQATNKIKIGEEALLPQETLEKDGTDSCDGWLCTPPFTS